MKTTRARSNPVTTNEKIAIGVGLALGVGGLIFLFTRPSAAAQKQPQQGMVDKNGKPISVDNQPPAQPPVATPPVATPPPVVPPPAPPAPPPPSTHPLLDAAVAALKAVDQMWANFTDVQTQVSQGQNTQAAADQAHALWKQSWDTAYLAMSGALRGGELGTTGPVFTDAQNALVLADGIRDNWVDAQAAVDKANAEHNAPAIEAAENNLTTVSAQLDNARNDAYSKMSLAVTAQTIPSDAYQKAFSDLFNLGL